MPKIDARLLELPYCSWEWNLGSGKLKIKSCALGSLCPLSDLRDGAADEGSWMALLPQERAAELDRNIREILLTQDDFHLRLQRVQHGEPQHFVLHGVVAERDAAGRPLRVVGLSRHETGDEQHSAKADFLENRDLEERRKMENILMGAQRFASITQISGSVAHDLNNLLSPIRMSVELLRRKLNDPALNRYVEIIEESTARARAVVQQLLSFARSADLGQQERVDLNALLGQLEKMVQTTFPPRIRISFDTSSPLPPVTMNADQLHQAILNILINARDAIEGDGQLRVHTSIRQVNVGVQLGGSCLPAGNYATISISDTGCGMTPEIQQRIFDPFFTTKEKDKGTGLGLASVYGIIAAAGGFIEVESTYGLGSTFHVCLPVKDDRPPT